MKKFWKVAIIFLAVLSLDVGLAMVATKMINSSLALADSGFDFDYDYDYGGGSSGGGSWGDDWGGSSGGGYGGSSGSSGGSTTLTAEEAKWFLLIIAGITVIAVLISVLVTTTRKNRVRKGVIKMRAEKIERRYGLPQGQGIDKPEIKEAFETYVKVQNAWTARDLTPVRHLLSDELYNMYQMQLDTLIENKQINIMENMNLYSGRILLKSSSKKGHKLQVLVTVSLNDYIVDEKSKAVVKGKKNRKIACVYELTFVKSRSEVLVQNCPSCGARVENNMSTQCPHCTSSLLMQADHYTLTNKRILDQYELL